MMSKADEFWAAYLEELSEAVQSDPSVYWLREGENAIDFAKRVAHKMRETVEAKGFGAVNYRESASFRLAAKRVGVPFNRNGLDSLYSAA